MSEEESSTIIIEDFENSKNEIILTDNENFGTDLPSNSTPAGSGAALFPLARIKKIMKADKEVNLVSAEAVNLVSLATELFVDILVKRASEISQNEKRRTILYRDFAIAVKQDVRYSFLQELIPETVGINAALEAQKQHGMVSSLTPNQSPVHETDDHFDNFRASSSSTIKSLPSSKSSNTNNGTADFFAKRTTSGNVNFLLNSNNSIISNSVDEDIIEIADDININ